MIGFEMKGLEQVKNALFGFSKQMSFATALALTRTAQAAQKAMPQALQRSFDRPTAFTLNAFAVRPATKVNQAAYLVVKPAQAQYLVYGIFGGERRPQRVALRLPAEIQLDPYGNLPKGTIAALVARARAGKALTKRQSQRFGVSRDGGIFYGDPSGARPPGLYQRKVVAGRHVLVPLVVMPAKIAHYRARFDLVDEVQTVFDRVFSAEFAAALDKALATAR